MDDALPQNQPLVPGLVQRVLEWLHRYRHVLAPLTFAAGVASFLLFEREARVAQALAVLLLLSFLLLLLEAPLSRRLRLTPGLLRFAVQAIHQEAFFFSLPFFFVSTTWASGQAGFTVLVTLAGLCALWDPLYFGQIAKRRWLHFAFHAFAIFAAMLVALPMVLHLSTAQSFALSCAAIGLFTAPSLAGLRPRRGAGYWLALLAAAAVLGGLAWTSRPWVPPATLWVQQGLITRTVDTVSKNPGAALTQVPAAQMHGQGLFAYTAIAAPRGLRENIVHRWVQNGIEVDRIPMEIAGGRKEGYRAWSFKRGFPADPRGDWRVEAMTAGGQLIGRIEFTVTGELPAIAPPSAPPLPAPVQEPSPLVPGAEAAPQAVAPEPRSESEPPEPVPEPAPVSPAPSAPESSPP